MTNYNALRFMIEPVDKAPLILEEKDALMAVYTQRMRQMTLFYAATVLAFMMLFYSPRAVIVGEAISESIAGLSFVSAAAINTFPGAAARFLLALTLASIACVVHYRIRIRPYKTDAEDGYKYKIPFKVTDKQYYPVTGQYMVHLYPLNHMVEVDADTFNNCKEGGNLFLWQTIRSRYVFTQFECFEEND